MWPDEFKEKATRLTDYYLERGLPMRLMGFYRYDEDTGGLLLEHFDQTWHIERITCDILMSRELFDFIYRLVDYLLDRGALICNLGQNYRHDYILTNGKDTFIFRGNRDEAVLKALLTGFSIR